MRKLTLILVLAVAAAAVVPATAVAQSNECSFPVERADATGTEVTIAEEPASESVVTLNPSAAQTMWEIGAQETVVGVTKHAMNLPGAESKTNISSNEQTISNEEVV
jgi:iron complex transport system substrate-binding protein